MKLKFFNLKFRKPLLHIIAPLISYVTAIITFTLQKLMTQTSEGVYKLR